MTQLLKDLWLLVAGFVGLTGWAIRLETRAKRNSDDIMRESTARKEELMRLEERLANQRREDMESRQRDWSEMKDTLKQVQADIRELLQRTSG